MEAGSGKDEGSKEKGPSYYDKNLRGVLKPLGESPWLEVYKVALELLPAADENRAILDLGCGTGRFARLLADEGYRNYQGVDFSPARIQAAQAYVPEFEFSVADIYELSEERVERMDVFVLLEVLEHVENDLALLERIPGGRMVILSVPNYPSASHVRHFDSIEAVRLRFGDVLSFEGASIRIVQNPRRSDKKIFLIGCTRKCGS